MKLGLSVNWIVVENKVVLCQLSFVYQGFIPKCNDLTKKNRNTKLSPPVYCIILCTISEVVGFFF